MKSVRKLPSGVIVVREASVEPLHKLGSDDRKQRRQDNKAMKELHSKARRRRTHGRPKGR